MKIDITAALEALQEHKDIKGENMIAVKVELARYSNSDTPFLRWDLYAYGKDGKSHEWSGGQESFPEALKVLLAKLKNEKTFIEE